MRRGAAKVFLIALAALLPAILWTGATLDISQAAESHDLSLMDFAYGVQVIPPGDAVGYRASLPVDVYRKITRADLSDASIFNARGEVVPYTLERPRDDTRADATSAPLPLFPLRGDPTRALDAIRVTIESGGAKVGISVAASGTANAPASAAPADGTAVVSPGAASDQDAATMVAYVLDGRALQSPAAALQLSWPDDAPAFAGRLRVESSDDLRTWRTIDGGAPLANLRAGDARLVESRIEVPPTRARFWRLTWMDAPAPFVITSVAAELQRERVDVARETLAVPGRPVANQKGAFEFDLGAQPPVDRINLELPESNSIVDVELLSRARPDLPWRPVTRSGFYRLRAANTGPTQSAPHSASDASVSAPLVSGNGAGQQLSGGEMSADLTNRPIPVEPNADRYWLARVDARSGGFGNGIPRLRVGWLPHDVVFLARGAGPFTLAYGSAAAHSASASLAAMPTGITLLRATFAAPRPLGGDSRLQPVIDAGLSKSVILWVVLILGVAILAYMAYRLVREMK